MYIQNLITMNNTDIKIYGKFVNELVDNKLADAKQIYDEDYILIHPEDGESVDAGNFQNKINKDFKESITDIQSTISDIATHGYVDDKTAAIATNVSNLSESLKTRLSQYEKKISIIDITDVNIPDLLTWTETDAKNGLYTYSFSINNTNLYNNINTAIQDLERTVGIEEYHPAKYNSAKLVLAYKYNSNVYLAWSVNTDVHNIFEWVVFYSSAEGSVKTGSIELQLGGDGSTINGVARYTATKIIDSYTKAEIDSKLDNVKSSNDIVATIKATRYRPLDQTTMQSGDPVITITDADGLYDKMVLGSKVAINYSDLINNANSNSDLVLYIGKKDVTLKETGNQQQTSSVTTYTASFDDGNEKYILTVDSTGSNTLVIK